MTKWCNKHSCTGPLSDEQQHATSQTVFSLSPHPLEQLAFLPDRTNGQWQGYDKTIHGHGLENTKSWNHALIEYREVAFKFYSQEIL